LLRSCAEAIAARAAKAIGAIEKRMVGILMKLAVVLEDARGLNMDCE
jgi:hypothetical protein